MKYFYEMKYFLSLRVLCNLTNNFSEIRASFPGRHMEQPQTCQLSKQLWATSGLGFTLAVIWRAAGSAYIAMSSCFRISIRDLPREHECKDKKRSLRTRMGTGNVGECKRLSRNPKMKRQLHSHLHSGFDVVRTVCQPNYSCYPQLQREMELVLHLK